MNGGRMQQQQHGPGKPAKVEFFQWAVKWYYASLAEDTTAKPDIPSLICVLQTIGFKLREFERRERPADEEPRSPGSVRVSLECGSSGMAAVLEMDEVVCDCPDNSLANDGSLWSVTGTAPMDNSKNVEETGSNLLPKVPKATMQVVGDVIYKLLAIINSKGDDIKSIDLNKNFFSPHPGGNKMPKVTKERLIRSYTDLYTEPSDTAHTKNKLNASSLSRSKSMSKRRGGESKPPEVPKLRREGTYEMEEPAAAGRADLSAEEPRSPPPPSSSPDPRTRSASLDQLSMVSDDDVILADFVVQAHYILDGAVKYIMQKMEVDSSDSSQDDSSTFAKPTMPPLMSSSFSVSSPRGSVADLRQVPTASLNSSRASSVGSQASGLSTTRTIPKPATSRASTGSLALPARDRSNSIGSAQRQNLGKCVPPPGPIRRNTSLAINTSGLGQRPGSVGLKQPSCVKPAPAKPAPTDRASLLKRRSSPAVSLTSSAAAKPQQQQANTSLIKPPTGRYSAGNVFALKSPKFGFAGKK